MKYYNFGPSIISWISLFQNGSESCIIQNGFISEFFNLRKGCRQGDPISPYVFILCAEILGNMVRDSKSISGIKINEKEFRLSQYADDTQIFLDGTEKSLKETLNILKTFNIMSGLKINVEKTRAIWIGSLSNSNRQLCKEYELDWSQGPFKILGVMFTAEVFNIWDVNTEQIYKNIENICKQWSKRKLTLSGRITIIKSLALAKFIHLFLALPNPPGDLVKKLEKMFFKFLWNSGPDRIKRSIIIKDLTVGGLRMVNINMFIKALKVSWLRRVIKITENTSWCSLSKIDFEKLFTFGHGYINELQRNSDNPFWRCILVNWQEFCNNVKIETTREILDSPLWYNNNLRNGSNYCIYDWYRKGIRQVSDLLDEFGNFYDFEYLKDNYGVRGTFLDLQSVKMKIPNHWKTILDNNKTVYMTTRFNIKCNIYLQQVIKDKKGCRRFYDIMTSSYKSEVQNKWFQELGFITDNELKTYNTELKYIKEIKLRDFQYKVTNKILVTKTFLHRINKVDNDLCEYCKCQPETIFHLFIECEKVKQFGIC